MKIEKITLKNFGSYEGITEFDLSTNSSDKNIILIGGKNGAGKTTLFTAIRLCLYGYMSMGHKSPNSFYNKAIIKLINNNAKMTRPVNTEVILNIAINNRQDIDYYTLTRSWTLSDTVSESFIVIKNGNILSEDDTINFEKFILSLIPPELFNLYFFDGEKIADYFMEEGSNTRIKNAFLTLCGYDIFDIMRKNFKRVSGDNEAASPALTDYLNAKDNYSKLEQEYEEINRELSDCKLAIDLCGTQISELDKDYSKKGGITQEEWNTKMFSLKEEEKKRETWNAYLKKWANDIIPFIMIIDQILLVQKQIENENASLKYRNFCEVLCSKQLSTILKSDAVLEKIKKTAFETYGSNDVNILDLSFEQSSELLSLTKKILSFDSSKISKYKTAIKRSISKSAKVRQELENSNVSSVNEYMQNRGALFEKKSTLLNNQIQHEQSLQKKKTELDEAFSMCTKAQITLESELKKASINDISARAIVMLDRLQDTLYRKQIEKVQQRFRDEIHRLMRKTHFIDDINIDDNFGVHLYRNEDISIDKLSDLLASNTKEQLETLLGKNALQTVYLLTNSTNISEAELQLRNMNKSALSLPIEMDKSSLSNGEKQIFIMALYYSLIQLCNHEIPFIIDTPFARIDTEHRRNISKYFFSRLRGQVFILSTNEEITSSHIQIMKEKILATYMLENTDNKKTTVVNNTYFEV